jgi:hypothetical protein
VRATLPYVALRDAAGDRVAFGKAALSWSARYVMIPPDEGSHAAFITSGTYPAAGGDGAAAEARTRAGALKQAFDALR